MLKTDAQFVQGEGSQRGFTIVELMIATMVFSVIMLISSAVVVRFTSNFQRGVVQNTTQNAARSIIDSVTQTLQVAPVGTFKVLEENSGARGYCIDGMRYSYALGGQIGTDTSHALVQDTGLGNACADPSDGVSRAQNIASSASGKELLSPNMRLANFTIREHPNGQLFYVNIKLAYGDEDLLCSQAVAGSCQSGAAALNVNGLSAAELDGLQCRGDIGSQYCGVSELSTTVQRRL